ncbi:hypothetical protein B0A48_06423 [Cryoendolithus antarcticus]|uniref:Uncharacterized protein n=1 Tax=Cryoendolithus antarcticus TaxID=1507870 RepID=A0A1V8TAX0_9PEZI|nr:hypothetical protein B0A48_06423 [Cryoendolithus antarcticus]
MNILPTFTFPHSCEYQGPATCVAEDCREYKKRLDEEPKSKPQKQTPKSFTPKHELEEQEKKRKLIEMEEESLDRYPKKIRSLHITSSPYVADRN